MCHDCEAGAVFATTVKQELLSPRLAKQELLGATTVGRNCSRHDDAAGTVICADCEAGKKCFRHDYEAGTVIHHDCEAGTVFCHDSGTGSVFATTVKREPLCGMTVKQEVFRHDDEAGTLMCHDCEAGTATRPRL